MTERPSLSPVFYASECCCHSLFGGGASEGHQCIDRDLGLCGQGEVRAGDFMGENGDEIVHQTKSTVSL